jgi:predicted kinase
LNDALPHLIVLTGRPASGKTTLVHRLASAVRCPAICRDEIKEGLVNTIGSDDGLDRATYEAFFDTVRLLLQRRVTLIAEAAFQHRLWSPKLEELREMADVRIVVCELDLALAESRYAIRNAADPRRPHFHNVGPMAEEYVAPSLDVPTLKVNTSKGYEPGFEAIVAFASGRAPS